MQVAEALAVDAEIAEEVGRALRLPLVVALGVPVRVQHRAPDGQHVLEPVESAGEAVAAAEAPAGVKLPLSHIICKRIAARTVADAAVEVEPIRDRTGHHVDAARQTVAFKFRRRVADDANLLDGR